MFIYVLIQSSDLFTKSSDVLKKHSGCKKSVRPIRSSPTYVQPKAVISAEAKKSPLNIFPKNLYSTNQLYGALICICTS